MHDMDDRQRLVDAIVASTSKDVSWDGDDDLAAFAVGIPGAAGWLAGDLARSSRRELARQVAEVGAREGDAGAHYCLGVLLEQAGDLGGALAAFLEAEQLPQSSWRVGNILRMTGDEAGALEVFRRAAMRDPECAVEYALDRDTPALEAKELLVSHLMRGVLDVLVPLAEIYERLDMREQQLECLRYSILAGEPNAPWNYAVALAEVGVDARCWRRLARHEGDPLAYADSGTLSRWFERFRARFGVRASRRDAIRELSGVYIA